MTEKTVLILGAGLMQEPAIQAAKNLGFAAAVVDADAGAPCAGAADFFSAIDLKDKDGILEYARRLQTERSLCAVFTAGTDFSASVSYVAEKLSLPCHSYEAALNASVKDRMRGCFECAAVPSPHFISLRGDAAIPDDLQLPLVVKPVDNMGARGCRLARNRDELYAAVAAARRYSRSATVIIEDYMEGREFSIDALVYNGAMTITGFADRHIRFPPYFIETGHTLPSAVSEDERRALIAVFALGVKALGLTTGAAKADIKLTPSGPAIGEIAARLSGGYMSGWTFPYASGLNLTEQGILIAAGMRPERLEAMRVPIPFEPPASCCGREKPFELFEIPCAAVSAERAWISIPGKIRSIEGISEAEMAPDVRHVFLRPAVKAGSDVDFPRNNVEKCGNVIASSASNAAVERAEDAVRKVFLRLEPNNERTEAFLAGRQLQDEAGFPPYAFAAYEALDAIDLSGEIGENQSAIASAPDAVLHLLREPSRDWTYSTALAAAERFDAEYKNHPALPKERFWRALFRGGFQAAAYVADSALKLERK